jgi:hypothetical protein
MERALLIMSDWAGRITLSEQNLEKCARLVGLPPLPIAISDDSLRLQPESVFCCQSPINRARLRLVLAYC